MPFQSKKISPGNFDGHYVYPVMTKDVAETKHERAMALIAQHGKNFTAARNGVCELQLTLEQQSEES